MKKLVLISCICLLWYNSIYAQNNTCINLLKKYFENGIKVRTNNKDVYKVNYTSIIKYNKEVGVPDAKLNTEIILSNNFFILNCESVSIYQDATDYFFIVHSLKRIMRNKPNNQFDAMMFNTMLVEANDSIIAKAKSIDCVYDTLSNRLVTIKIVQKDIYAQRSKIKAIYLTFNIDSYFLKETKIVNIDGGEIVEMRNIFKSVEKLTDYKLQNKISDYIINEKGKPIGRFAGYSIIDLRNYKSPIN